MPKYTQFYSATEAEATTSLTELCPQRFDTPHFGSDDAVKVEALVNGTLKTFSCRRNDVDQPLFRAKQAQSVEELFLNASGFHVAHETVYREKIASNDSTSEESTVEWKTRSRTPSSDEPSPKKRRAPASSLSVKAIASSDGSDVEMSEVAQRTQMKHSINWGSFPDHYTTHPDNVLQNMDAQFSKWSYDLDEGKTAVPFVMAQAPTDTHESLVKVDRELWVTGDESADRAIGKNQGAAKVVLERAQKTTKSPTPTKPTGVRELKSSGDGETRDDSASKRAALIAKGKAAMDSPLVISKSANQRRSAMYKNKHRKSIMSSPPHVARRLEPVKKEEVQTEQLRPNVLILDRKEDDQRRELDSVLQNGGIDWNNDRQLETLMRQLRSTGTDTSDTMGDTKENKQAGRTHRLKGKARKKAKGGAAR